MTYTEMRTSAMLALCTFLTACQNSPSIAGSRPPDAPPPAWMPSRAPTGTFPPGFSAAHLVGGSPAPPFPDSTDGAGNVKAGCTIGVDGDLANCLVLSQRGDPAYAEATLKWLTGSFHPIYRPAKQNGVAKAVQHTWQIIFLQRGQAVPAFVPDSSDNGTETEFIVVRK